MLKEPLRITKSEIDTPIKKNGTEDIGYAGVGLGAFWNMQNHNLYPLFAIRLSPKHPPGRQQQLYSLNWWNHKSVSCELS